jgi:lysophospholipase L1-like esterase
VPGVTGNGLNITFPAPTVTGGQLPVNVTCNPANGSSFPVGANTVTCSAIDALARQASCAFAVTLSPLVLTPSTFLAFGDSTTEGENGLFAMRVTASPSILDLEHAYPTLLLSLMQRDFPNQQVSVFNQGLGGEFSTVGTDRLKTTLGQLHPDALLLLDGFNDLLNFGTKGVNQVVESLRDMIQKARGAGVRYIYVSTFWPPGPPGSRRRIDPQAIIDVNIGIRQIAAAEGVTLVDPYNDFLGHETEYIADGLHLLPAGNQVVAQKFFDAILATATTSAAVTPIAGLAPGSLGLTSPASAGSRTATRRPRR